MGKKDGREGEKKKKKKKAMMLQDAPPELSFIESGVLNMIVVRHGKEVFKVDAYNNNWLIPNSESAVALANQFASTSPTTTSLGAPANPPAIVLKAGMDTITFQSYIVFKLTLEFSELLYCVPGTSVREATDWALCSCLGSHAFFDQTSKRLILQQCFVSIQSRVEPLLTPFCAHLRFEEDSWIVESVYR